MRWVLALVLICGLNTNTHAAEAGGPGHLLVQWPKRFDRSSVNTSIYLSEKSQGGYRLVKSLPVEEVQYCIGDLRAGRLYRIRVYKGSMGGRWAGSLLSGLNEFAEDGYCQGKVQSPEAMGDIDLGPATMFRGITSTTASLKDPPEKKDVLFGYGLVGPKGRFGSEWETGSDRGVCDTFFAYPKGGQSPMHSWSCVRMAGYLGYRQDSSKACRAVPYALIKLDFQQGMIRTDLAKAGFPTKGMRLLLRLGPGHANALQDYSICVHKASISGDMKDYKGNDYEYIVRGEQLSADEWREIRAPFPKEGKMAKQPSGTFAQPEWNSPSLYRAWSSEDLTHVNIGPTGNEANFDLLVGGVAFY